MNKIFLGILLFVPIAIGAKLLGVSPIVVFILSALAIVPLAKYIGEATEELTVYTGPAVGGLLNATFGNATELIIAIFALRAGLTEVVKASLTGSIIGNLLLVLGMAILAGGWKREKQTFNIRGAKTSASTLLLAVIALVIPAVFLLTSPGIGHQTVETVSIIVSVCMIVAYVANLFFTLHTHKHWYSADVAEESHSGRWSKSRAIITLLVATIAVAFMSELLVGSIEPLVASLGWTELFVGVIFVAIIGNAAEHASAITVAIKNKMDLSLQVAVGSSTQIAMFVAPLLVLISLFFAKPMDLVFHTFELVVIIFSVLIANSIIEDGESHWFEGVQLLITYVIIAVAFFFHP
ncbi:MAG: putative H+/Ca2+ exchanging protein [Patescibacteria group bacterium]|nr:putative H+/Ca2+ exchanging protein [Patescibacteria group bacterium]